MKKKFMKRAGAGTLAVLMAAFGLAACGSTDSGSGDNTQVVLNEVAHSIFYAPMYVAIEEGYFADEGIDLTLVTGFGADKTMTAVLTDEADIGFMGSESTIYTYAGGTQDYVVNFAQLTQRAGNFLVGRTPEDDFSWQDLKGKKVLGGRAGGMPQMVFEYILKENGIDFKLNFVLANNLHVLVVEYPGRRFVPFNSVASTGTNSLELFFHWKTFFPNIKFLFIDEFDAFLHYESAKKLIMSLNEADNFQSILTTHNTYLMNNRDSRPDCCYILSKGTIKNLVHMTDKEIREAHNLEKMYLSGAFNA